MNSQRNGHEVQKPYQASQRDMMEELGESLRDILTLSDLVRTAHTERLFVLAPALATGAVALAVLAAILTSDGRSLLVWGDIVAATALACYAFAAFAFALACRHTATAYLASPLPVQCLFLVAVKSAALYLAGRSSWDELLAVVLVATVGAAFAEVIAMAWRIRQVDSEPVVVLQRVGRVVAVALAAVTASSIYGLFR